MLHTMTEIVIQLYTIIIVECIITITIYNVVKYCIHFTFYEASHHRQQPCKKKSGFEQKYGKPSLKMVCSTHKHAGGMW